MKRKVAGITTLTIIMILAAALDRLAGAVHPDAVSAATSSTANQKRTVKTPATEPGVVLGAAAGGEGGGEPEIVTDEQVQQALERVRRTRGRRNRNADGTQDGGNVPGIAPGGRASVSELGELFKQAEASFKAEQYGPAYEYFATVAACRAVPGAEGLADKSRARLLEIDKKAGEKLEAAKLARLQGKPLDALAVLRELLTQYPCSRVADEARGLLGMLGSEPRVAAEVALLKAEELDAAGSYAEAAAAYAAIMKDFPDSVPALKAELRLRAMKEDPEISALIAEGTVKTGGEDAAKLLRRANNFHMNGMSDRAKPLYEEIVAKYPDSEAAAEAKAKLAEMDPKPQPPAPEEEPAPPPTDKEDDS